MTSNVGNTTPNQARLSKELELAQLDVLIKHIPTAVVGNAACSILIIIGLWNVSPHPLLIFWLLAVYIIAAIRLFLPSLFRSGRFWATEPHKWITAFSLSSGVSGATWGFACYALVPIGNPESMLLMVIITAGICSGASITLGHQSKAATLFLLCSVPPLAIRLLQEGSDATSIAAFGCLVYLIILIRGIHTSERFLDEKIHSDLRAQHDRQRLSNHLARTPLAAIEWDSDFKVISWNKAAEEMFGYPAKEIIGQHADFLIPKDATTQVYNTWAELVETGDFNTSINENCCADGRTITCEWHNSALVENGQFTGASSFAQDISERIERENLIRHQAHYDSLTNLPNRIFFKERLSQALSKAKRRDGLAAVLLIDLDHFKDINDSRGHDTGDLVLKHYASMLKQHLRHCDTISRLGGDEFVILIDNLSTELPEAQIQISEVANKIQLITETPIPIKGHNYHIGCSIGITLIDGSEDAELIMKRADLALYSVKENERGDFSFYREELASQAERHLELHNSLHNALENNEFELFYQAKVDLQSNEIIGCEALIRWHSQEHGFVSPNEFIHLIENSSLIEDVGSWVIDEACRQVKYWRDIRLWNDNMIMAVNVGVRQLLAKDFPDQINHAINRHEISGHNLELEITERLFIQDSELAKKNMDAVAAIGPTFAIDDFGTGYSCLSYLKSLPLQTLKVDKSFLDPLLTSNKDDTLIKTVLYICEQLNLKSVAEGVEEETQRLHLQQLNCDFYQGYLHSKPMNQKFFEAQLIKQKK